MKNAASEDVSSQCEAAKSIRQANPGRVPIICKQEKQRSIPGWATRRSKFLVSHRLNVGRFRTFVKDSLVWKGSGESAEVPDVSLFLAGGAELGQDSLSVSELDDLYGSPDGFLYLTYMTTYQQSQDKEEEKDSSVPAGAEAQQSPDSSATCVPPPSRSDAEPKSEGLEVQANEHNNDVSHNETPVHEEKKMQDDGEEEREKAVGSEKQERPQEQELGETQDEVVVPKEQAQDEEQEKTQDEVILPKELECKDSVTSLLNTASEPAQAQQPFQTQTSLDKPNTPPFPSPRGQDDDQTQFRFSDSDHPDLATERQPAGGSTSLEVNPNKVESTSEHQNSTDMQANDINVSGVRAPQPLDVKVEKTRNKVALVSSEETDHLLEETKQLVESVALEDQNKDSLTEGSSTKDTGPLAGKVDVVGNALLDSPRQKSDDRPATAEDDDILYKSPMHGPQKYTLSPVPISPKASNEGHCSPGLNSTNQSRFTSSSEGLAWGSKPKTQPDLSAASVYDSMILSDDSTTRDDFTSLSNGGIENWPSLSRESNALDDTHRSWGGGRGSNGLYAYKGADTLAIREESSQEQTPFILGQMTDQQRQYQSQEFLKQQQLQHQQQDQQGSNANVASSGMPIFSREYDNDADLGQVPGLVASVSASDGDWVELDETDASHVAPNSTIEVGKAFLFDKLSQLELPQVNKELLSSKARSLHTLVANTIMRGRDSEGKLRAGVARNLLSEQFSSTPNDDEAEDWTCVETGQDPNFVI